MWLVLIYLALLGVYLGLTIPRLRKKVKKGNIYLAILGNVMAMGGLLFYYYLVRLVGGDLELWLILAMILVVFGIWIGNRETKKEISDDVEKKQAD
jgi:uncharacterized membrane protein YhaH (DUF805 family)